MRIHVAEARSFIDASGDLYDIVQISLLDSFAAAAGGLHGWERARSTRSRPFDALLDRLAPDGLLGDHALGQRAAARPAEGVRHGGRSAAGARHRRPRW